MAHGKWAHLRLTPPMVATNSFTNFTLDASTDKAEYIFRAIEDITCTRLGFRQGAVTGTSPVYKISLQGVDATTGYPDGTVKGGGSPASATFTPVGGGDGTFQWITLDNSFAITRADELAMVIEYSSGTIDVSNNCSFTTRWVGHEAWTRPYPVHNDAGSRTKQAAPPVWGYGSSTAAYGTPVDAIATSVFNQTSSPDEKGLKFTLPAEWGDTFEIVGAIWGFGDWNDTNQVNVKLYDTDGSTVLQQVTQDQDVQRTTNAAIQQIQFDESTLSTLSFGSTYRITLAPTATNISMVEFSVASAADLEAFALGSNIVGTSRTDAGAWTDSTTTRYHCELILNNITEPAGGGNIIVPRPVRLF